MDKKKWWTLVAVCAGTFMLLLDVTIVTVAQPAIQGGLHAGFSDVQWVLDAYALTLASLLLTSGVLADRYGRKRLFQTGLVIFALGSLLCGLARDPLMLILSRSAQGVGGAIMFATSLALLGNSFRGRDRGVAFGVWGAVTGVSTALGPVLGGVITSDWSWRGIFLVNVPIGVLAVALTAWRVEESKSQRPTPPDWAGFALLTGGLVSLIYGLIRAGEDSWSDTGVIACLVIGGAALAGFVAAERRVAHPMFDLSLLRVPTFAGGSIAAFAMNGSLYAVLLFLVIYLQDILGYSAEQAGLRLAIISGAQFVTATVAGRVSERVPARWLIGPGLLLVGIGLIIMGGLSGKSSWTDLIPGFIVSGLGVGMVNPPLASTAIGVVPPHQAGMASGVNSTFRQVGIAAGIAALGSIFATALERNLAHALAVPSLRASTASEPRVAAMVRQGQVGQLLASLPAATRGQVAAALRSAFAAGLNDLLLVTGALAVGGALCALLLIRSRALSPSQQSDRSQHSVTGQHSGPAGRTEPEGASPAAGETVAGGSSPARSA
jgi:EmrB/QacA subfamily drug resistance transporter